MLMKQIKFLLLMIFSASLLSGCYHNPASLKRAPQPRQTTVKKRPAPKLKKKKNNSDDPLFDAIFRRDPQKFDKESMLSERERQLIREYDVRNDENIKGMHDRDSKTSSAASDWVFGTKNGKHF